MEKLFNKNSNPTPTITVSSSYGAGDHNRRYEVFLLSSMINSWAAQDKSGTYYYSTRYHAQKNYLFVFRVDSIK